MIYTNHKDHMIESYSLPHCRLGVSVREEGMCPFAAVPRGGVRVRHGHWPTRHLSCIRLTFRRRPFFLILRRSLRLRGMNGCHSLRG